MKAVLTTVLTFLFFQSSNAQSLAVNTDGSLANSSAILDIKSSTKGLLIPRLTKTEKNDVTTPAAGLLIYQTGPDSIGFYYYQNSQWNWVTDNSKSDSSYWGLHGNSNMHPPSSINYGSIDFANDTYLGTTESKDISMIAGGNELLRLKQVPLGGRIGFSNRNPDYALDIRLSDPSPETAILGMRVISSQLFDFNLNGINVNKGMVFGNSATNANEMVIWNHANNIDGSIRLGFDIFDGTIQPAINITQFGEGIYQRNPKYALDIHSMSQFSPANQLTPKNGVRITYPNQLNQNDPERGMFMGLVTNVPNTYKSFIWNYADGSGSNSPDKAIYFGVGPDMDFSNQRPTMEMQDGKIMMGHLASPNFFYPSTVNIETDYASGVAKNGLSIMKHLSTGVESVYFGTDGVDNLNIFKYGGNKILIGNPVDYTLTINSNNQVGIKTYTPNADLQFADTYANNKLVLHNNFWGDFPNNEHNFYGFGVNTDVLRYQVPKSSTDHVFYSGNVAGTASVELMRITGDGYVGINNNNPQAPLEFSSVAENRKIVLGGFGINNDHNFVGFGLNGLDLRYQVPYSNSDHVFYRGDVSGSSSTELLRIKGNGNVGIGTTIPSDYGHIGTNRILELRNSQSGVSDVQSHLILSTYGQLGSLGGITWAGLNLTGEQRTGFIGNVYETYNATKLVFYTRSEVGVLAEKFNIQSNGDAWLAGTLTSPSDVRLKTNIHQLNNSLEKLNQLNGYTYNWIDQSKDKNIQMGLIAQEVQKVYPQLVKENDKGELSVNYIGMIPVLLESIKELQKEIELLKNNK